MPKCDKRSCIFFGQVSWAFEKHEEISNTTIEDEKPDAGLKAGELEDKRLLYICESQLQ